VSLFGLADSRFVESSVLANSLRNELRRGVFVILIWVGFVGGGWWLVVWGFGRTGWLRDGWARPVGRADWQALVVVVWCFGGLARWVGRSGVGRLVGWGGRWAGRTVGWGGWRRGWLAGLVALVVGGWVGRSGVRGPFIQTLQQLVLCIVGASCPVGIDECRSCFPYPGSQQQPPRLVGSCQKSHCVCVVGSA
jgi:hypothetical protein